MQIYKLYLILSKMPEFMKKIQQPFLCPSDDGRQKQLLIILSLYAASNSNS